MEKVKAFLKRKDIVFSAHRYGIDALGAMAQGLFASLLVGTILSTIGTQLHLPIFAEIGGYAQSVSGSAMAVAIGVALHCPPLVLFSLVAVGYSANALGGAGGPLSVLVIAIVAAITGPIATCIFGLQMNGPAISSGMGTCGLVGPIGVYTGWVSDVASGAKEAITAFDWIGLLLICIVLPAVLCWALGLLFRKAGWIKDGDLKLD